MKKYRALLILVAFATMFVACSKAGEKGIEHYKNTEHSPGTEYNYEDDPNRETPVYDLYISEVMADNTNMVMNTDDDWIEIGSREGKTVSLSGYYLTDDLENPNAVSLAGNLIEKNGYVVVRLSKDAAFHLDSKGESVFLICNGQPVDVFVYTEEIGHASASSEGVLPYATPGYPNTEAGYKEYLANLPKQDLLFTEIVSSNTKYAAEDGNFYDFVELYNNSDKDINLSAFYLTNKDSELNQYRLPEKVLSAGEYYVVYCSGLEAEGHAPFKISSSGEKIYLTNGSETLDYIKAPKDLEQDKSYGRYEGEFVYMDVPTPGKPNNAGFSARVQVPKPNVEPGLYGDPIQVELLSDGTIYYTTDGTMPTEKSKVYNGAISMSSPTTIRAFAKSGDRVSEMGIYTYMVGVEHTLPIVYVSIPSDNRDKIVGTPAETIEKESVISLYEDGEIKFSVPCGFRLHGNDSRKGAKQNFQIRFRSKYGESKLKYKLFDDMDLDKFDSLLLKGGSEDYPFAVMRDEFFTGLVRGKTALEVLACKPCVLYLGDKFWGIYYIRERFCDEYVADHYGVSKESVNLLETYGSIQCGTSENYWSLMNFVKKNDMTKDENYKKALEQIDATSLMDWYICRSYMGDKDVANIRFFQSAEYDNKWRWMFFDLDWAFWHTEDQPVKWILTHDSRDIIQYFMKNKNFKDAFLKRYAELMNTILNEQYITDELNKFAAMIEPEIPADRQRWGYTVQGWNDAVQKMRNYVKDGARTKRVLQDIKSYFGLSDDQMKGYFGSNWK